MRDDVRVNPPAHLWVMGIVGLLWNAFGGYDYVMTNIRDPGYIAQFPPEMMQIIDAFPVWVMASWACGVWGAILGSLLLLLRSRFAVPAFAASLTGLAVSTLYQASLDMPPPLRSPAMIAMNAVIWAVAIGLLLYASRMRRQGVLR